ncbi:T9SS type A sorting domain-containing protein [Vicingaceae bacterium]|nr:T9SS type A sorting domain-containing protein [Vicingaceae bacterium]
MINKLLISFLSLVSTHAISQNITNISCYPMNPNTTDTIYFHVESTYPNSSCWVINSGTTISGNNIEANGSYCHGANSSICNSTDTFIVLPLSFGNYSFLMKLNQGIGSPCSPGTLLINSQVFNFSVSQTTGIFNKSSNTNVLITPNPSSGIFKLNNLNNTQIIVNDILGNEIVNIKNLSHNYRLDLTDYPSGVFFIKAITNGKLSSYRLVKN